MPATWWVVRWWAGKQDADPTPFVSAEDFDFGLFIANVIGDPGRRDRIYARR
jgi:hypothetical protein